MMTINDYITVMESILDNNIREAEKEPPYKENRYSIEEYIDGLNEGYVAGLRDALKSIENSHFLAYKNNEPRRLLKPCPFCGEFAFINTDETGAYFGVECFGCNAMISNTYESREEAAEAWNNRRAK